MFIRFLFGLVADSSGGIYARYMQCHVTVHLDSLRCSIPSSLVFNDIRTISMIYDRLLHLPSESVCGCVMSKGGQKLLNSLTTVSA